METETQKDSEIFWMSGRVQGRIRTQTFCFLVPCIVWDYWAYSNLFLHTYLSLYKPRHWNDCPWKLGALCTTKVISCWHTNNGTWWVWTEEIVETTGGCWLQLLPGDVAGDQHGAWAFHLGPSQFHVSYVPKLRKATSKGQEEGSKPNFSSAPHPLLGLFSQSYDH